MISLWQAPAVAVWVMTWWSMPPAGLEEAARREALRRSATARSIASLNNMNLPAVAEPAEQTVTMPAQAAIEAAPVPAPPPPDDRKRDEQWWRARIAAARRTLDRDRLLADALQSQINALRTDIATRDDPAQQALARQQLARALEELERLKTEIAEDSKTIAAIEDEARREGVPPGWIR